MSFGNLYKIPFSATLTTNPCDLVGILAHPRNRASYQRIAFEPGRAWSPGEWQRP